MDPILDDFLTRVDSIKPQLESVYLFGSRARGDERPASDFDLCIILREGANKRAVKEVLYEHATDIWLESGKDISMKVLPQAAFREMQSLHFPFIQNVLREGIRLG